MKTLLVAVNAKYIHSNPAIYSLKAYAGELGKDIILGEYTINNLIDTIIDDIYEKKPDFIGFSTYIWNVEYVMKAAGQLKKLLPDCVIWLGGPEVTYNAEEILKSHEFIDGIMCGEGEATFLQLLKHYKEASVQLKDIKGIVCRNGGSIVNNGFNDLIDMSDIPFIYDSIENFENRIIYYESSRGCPFSCSYCLSSVDKSVRFRNIDMVLSELGFFIEKKVNQVKFVDRTFNCKKSHTMAILKFIGEHDNGITNFHFEIAADLLDDEEIALIKTFRPGLIQLEIGVQSLNEKTISEIHRKMDIDKVRYVVAAINEGKNVMQHLDIIAGLPYEDFESFKRTFNGVYKMKPSELQLGFLKVLSGSYMNEKTMDYGIVHRDYPPYEVLYTKWLSHDELCILKRVEEVLEIYYNSMQYKYTADYMEGFFETPFDMYLAIADYYQTLGGEKGKKYSRQDRYNILYEFFNSICEDKAAVENMKEILTFDIYLRENVKKRPYFAENVENRKQKLYELYREAEKEYKEQQLHIEHFNIDIEEFVKSGRIVKKDVYILFDYGQRNYIDNSAKIKEV